jgi:hypothetical protein
MGRDCHRCGVALASPDAFCPSCGAPQLLYEADADAVNGAADPGTAVPREIRWKQAIGAAVTFAVPVGVLCSLFIPLYGGWLWVIGGAVGAVGLYQRRSGTRVLARGIGVRIGSIIGILAAAVAAAFSAGSMFVERYVLHSGLAIDKMFEASLKEGLDLAARLTQASPEQAASAVRFWSSPEGRATVILVTVVISSIGITVLSMIGGALGSRIFSGRNSSVRNT